MRLAAIASALAIILCAAVFGAIFLQRTSVSGPTAPALAAPGEGQAPAIGASARADAMKAAVVEQTEAPTVVAQAGPAPAPTTCSNPNALGIARTVEIDTTGGPGFGFEHFKELDFLRDKEVVLTFDDGPWPRNTPAVLKALADQCTTGIFFPIGKHSTYEPEILKQVYAAVNSGLPVAAVLGSGRWTFTGLPLSAGATSTIKAWAEDNASPTNSGDRRRQSSSDKTWSRVNLPVNSPKAKGSYATTLTWCARHHGRTSASISRCSRPATIITSSGLSAGRRERQRSRKRQRRRRERPPGRKSSAINCGSMPSSASAFTKSCFPSPPKLARCSRRRPLSSKNGCS